MLSIGDTSTKYITFWSAEDKGKFSDVKLGASEKNQAGEWENTTLFARFVGHAHNKVAQLSEKDKIEITQGKVSKKYVAEQKKEYWNITIFDFEKMDASGGSTQKKDGSFIPIEADEDGDDLPF